MLGRHVTIAIVLATLPTVTFASSPRCVSIQQLLRHPESFQRKIVSTEAYYSCEFDEGGCCLRATKGRHPWRETILLEFPPKQLAAFDKAGRPHGRLRVTGLFEYSRPTPDSVVKEADPRDPSTRQIVE